MTLYELATGKARHTYGRPGGTAENDDPLADFLFSPAVLPKTRMGVAISPDGKLLALAGAGGAVHVFDVLTGKELKVFKGHTMAINALAFAPHGKTLVSASDDTTALIWDVTTIARPAQPAKNVKPGDLDSWWQALADNDALKGFAALCDFTAVPGDAVPWIKDRVKPASPLDMKRVALLMHQLDDDQFKVRNRATTELLKIGERLLPFFDKALEGNLAPESRRRLEELRKKLMGVGLQGERLRVFRAVEVLERIATTEARQVLQTLANGAPGALTTTSALAALKR